jgi:hypothetical protein
MIAGIGVPQPINDCLNKSLCEDTIPAVKKKMLSTWQNL